MRDESGADDAVRRAEVAVASQARETVIVLAAEGRSIYHGAGERDRVAVPRGVLPGSTVIHNHPDGGSLSRTDVQRMLEHKIAQMRVVASDAVYILDLPTDTEWHDVEELVTIIMDEVRERHRDLVLGGTITYEESERRRWHDIWTGVSEIRGWAYRREARLNE